MFKELAPFLRQRSVLLTVTHLEEDQIRVNLIPQKIKDGENSALTTPLSVTGTGEELDRDLPSTIVNFVSSHMQLRNTLDRAQAEMDAAAKAATAEAAAKKKAAGVKKDTGKPETTAKAESTPKPAIPIKPEPPKAPSLFGDPEPEAPAAETASTEEEDEILAETRDDEEDEDDELSDAA